MPSYSQKSSSKSTKTSAAATSYRSTANDACEVWANEGFLAFVADIKSILQEKEIEVPDPFIINIIKLTAIDPAKKFFIRQNLVPIEVDRLRRVVVERIISMSEISRAIIKMQLHFRENYKTKEEAVLAFRDTLDVKLHPLMSDLKNSTPKNLRHYDLYYTKLLCAAILFAGMGPDSEHSVVNETKEILEKIFHKNDIDLLVPMNCYDREKQLIHMFKVITGLRLLMKNQKPKGYGEFIQDLVGILPKMASDGLKQLHGMKSMNNHRLILYTTAIQKYFLKHFSIQAGRRELSIEMLKARQALTMVNQLVAYIKKLTVLLTTEEKHVLELASHHDVLMKQLKEDKGGRGEASGAGMDTTLYPQYKEISDIWQEMVDSNVFLEGLLKLAMDLVQFSEKELIPMDDFMNRILEAQNLHLPNEHEFFNFPLKHFELEHTALGLTHTEFRADTDLSKMDFAGFCVNSFVRGAGMLIHANPNMGIFTWKHLNLIFATPDAALEFSRNPTIVLKRAFNIARRWPELISLLNIETEVFDSSSMHEFDGFKKFFSGLLVSTNVGVQSETHPIPENIVESYTWNEWELRRRGIILSKIHNCRTHSTQTYWQALKTNSDCQTDALRSQEVQTDRNVFTSVPRTKYYFAGLRGYHCGMPPHIVELTSETPEDLYCVCKPKPEIDMAKEILKFSRQKKKQSLKLV